MAKQNKAKPAIRAKSRVKEDSPRNQATLFSLLIFTFSFLIYSNSIFNSYNLDDELVTQNHHLTSKGISAIPEIFKSPYFENEQGFKYEYRPIVLISFAIEHSLFGENAHVSHLINVILYSFLCVLLFVVLQMLLNNYSQLFVFVVSMVFVAHPIHTEVVASIKNRDEILSLVFALLSLYFAVRYIIARDVFFLLFLPVLFLAGVLSKSTVITFSLLIPLSLTMFTAPKLRQSLVVTFVLAIPAAVFSRMYSLLHQAELLVIIFMVIFVIHYLKDRILFSEQVRKITNKVKEFSARPVSNKQASVQYNFSFLKKKENFIAVLLLAGATIIASGLGIYINRVWPSVASIMLIGSICLEARKEVKAIFITPISVITLFVLIKFNVKTSLMEAALVVFLTAHIFQGEKILRIIGLLNYAVYVAVSLFITHNFFFTAILMFAALINRKLALVTLPMLLASAYAFIKKISALTSASKIFEPALLALPVVVTGLLFLWKKHWERVASVSVFLIATFIVIHSFTDPPAFNQTSERQFRKNYIKLIELKAVETTPEQSLRPVDFIESPVDKSTSLNVKLGTGMVILGKYLKLIFIPFPMSYYYGYAYITPVDFFNFVPGVIFLLHVIFLVIALVSLRKIALLSYGILFYLISISVFSNLFISVPGMMGDRFLFIPSIGFCLFLAFLLFFFFKQDFTDRKLSFRNLSTPLKISLSVILIFYSILTFSRNFDWKDRVALFSHDINAVENSAQAQNLLALHLFLESGKEADAVKQKQMREEAVMHFKKALEIYPKFLNASFDLARTYETLGRTDEAYRQYEQSMKIDTSFVPPCFGMAIIQQNRGNLKAAIPLYEKFLTKYPYKMEVYANMSYAYFMLGDYQNSINVNKRALSVKPDSFEPVFNIAKTFQSVNQQDSALNYFLRAQRIKPNDTNVASSINTLQNQLKQGIR